MPNGYWNLSAASYALLISAGGMGGLAVIAAAIWVDRRPPPAMMAAGALAALLGLSVLALPASFAAFAAGMFVAGVGSSAVNPLIFYAIAVKGAARYRGTTIGALGMVFLLSPGMRGDIDWQFGESTSFIPVIAALTLAGTALLFVALPRVFTGAYEADQTQQVKPGAPGRSESLAVGDNSCFPPLHWPQQPLHILPYQIAMNSSSELLRLEPEFPTAPVFQAVNAAPVLHAASAAGVLLWGVASDFFALRRWLLLTAILFVLGAGGVWVFGSPLGPTVPSSGRWARPRRPSLPATHIDGGAASHPALRKASVTHTICKHSDSGNSFRALAGRPPRQSSPSYPGRLSWKPLPLR